MLTRFKICQNQEDISEAIDGVYLKGQLKTQLF